MKRTLALILLFVVTFAFMGAALDASTFAGGLAWRAVTGAQGGNVIFGVTPLGVMHLIGGTTFDNTTASTLTITETNIGLVGSVSITGSTSLYGAAIGIGYDVGAAMSIATTDTTGVMAITHAGSGPTMAWTIPAWTFTNSTSHITYTPIYTFGFDVGAAMTFTTTDTTGAVAITHAGSAPAITWTADSLGFVGDLDVNGATVVLDGSTSVRGISAAFTSLESPANRFGVNATEYISIATAATTGITTITHTGSAPAVTWTADSMSFVGDFDSNGATAALDGSTSVRLLSAGFVSSEAPDIRFGFSDAIYTKFAVADTTGNLTITHVGGTTDAVAWTAAGGFTFTGAVDLVGATAADALTLSDVLTFSDAGTIDNTAADTLTITETNIVLEGIAKTNRIIIDDGDADVSIDSDNQTNATAAINIPDFVDATADFLVTNLFTVILPFHGGLAGEDTDAAGTNGGGMVGSTVDVTTHDYNSGAAGGDDVVCKVYDLTSTTWDDLSTAALLSAGADWAINYQLLPDADAEEAGDAFAVGFDEKFCEIVFNDLATNNGTLATWGGDGGKYQYSTGAGTWSDLTVFDNTDLTAQDGLRSLQRAGAITFVPPSDWVVATYDGEEAYWVQYVLTGAQLTQTPVIDDTNFDEPIVGIPTTDSFITPYKMSLAEVRVTNMGIAVHDQAIEFIVGNFTDGTFSAALTWTASQYSDWFDLAAEIACDAGDIIGIMITDDGGSTVNPIWAVEFEVTYED